MRPCETLCVRSPYRQNQRPTARTRNQNANRFANICCHNNFTGILTRALVDDILYAIYVTRGALTQHQSPNLDVFPKDFGTVMCVAYVTGSRLRDGKCKRKRNLCTVLKSSQHRAVLKKNTKSTKGTVFAYYLQRQNNIWNTES